MAKSKRRRQPAGRDQVRAAAETPLANWSDNPDNVRNGFAAGSPKSMLPEHSRSRSPVARTVRAKAIERATNAEYSRARETMR